MENYMKGKNVEEELKTVPIDNLPEDYIWMHVKGGSKINGLIECAKEGWKNGKAVVWSGSGAGITKAISCAEIFKRNFAPLHQFNKVCYVRCEEHWEPKLEGLDKLVVNRDIPSIHILLSKEPINSQLPGYQAPVAEKVKPKRPYRPKNFQKNKKDGISSPQTSAKTSRNNENLA